MPAVIGLFVGKDRWLRPVTIAVATVVVAINVSISAQRRGSAPASATAEVFVPAESPDVVGEPSVRVSSTTLVRLPGSADSNSPAVWSLVDGRPLLHIFTSFAGKPNRSEGVLFTRMGSPTPVDVDGASGGVWMESVVRADDETWYGYYHNELVASQCGPTQKVIPRIGAARSLDRGLTWQNLGTILESPGFTTDCDTNNVYFAGGVGDFSVLLDADSHYVYFFFSQYAANQPSQGVAVGRLPWAYRDEPVGRMAVWTQGVWLPSRLLRLRDATGAVQRRWSYPVANPIYPAAESWHDEDLTVDAFWGPSVHWNTHLRHYVMLLNRARNVSWDQEGIYVAFAPRLDPPSWSAPKKIINGGRWYPQVLGLEAGTGTDKLAGATARLFMNGESRHLLTFEP
ncbi:MAG: hypothetical protein AB7I50_03375 [Vicinamibacterales bacterium]